MAVFFLNPLALALLLGLGVYVWAVWRGWLRRWFGRDDRWTIVAWPLPAVVLAVPMLAGAGSALFGLAGIEIGEGSSLAAAAYGGAYLVPVVGLTMWPPRRLLPSWARARLTALPSPGPDTPVGAMAALNGRRGHASRARWVWQVDAMPGLIWIDDDWLRFRPVEDAEARAEFGAADDWDDEPMPELRLNADGDLQLEQPRGGWWSRNHLDIDLTQLDRCRAAATRPWRRNGLIRLEVNGRRPVCLWVDDVRSMTARLPHLR